MRTLQNNHQSIDSLSEKIISCKYCKRLREHCLNIAKKKRKAFENETYWGKPVPSFGPTNAKLILVGLAPAAHGANRTGRMFTGDRSGLWLYRALFKAGFSNQPNSESRNDRLKLKDAYITAAVHCAPPDNKPTTDEIARCSPYLNSEFEGLMKAKVYLALGKLAFDQVWKMIQQSPLKDQMKGMKKPTFGHGKDFELPDGKFILCSYHPSQQNTFTGRLTEPMFDAVFSRAKEIIYQ